MNLKPAVFALVLAAPSALAAQDTFDWKGPLGPGMRLEVRGIRGDIRAQAATGGEASVHAVKHGGDPRRVAIRVVEKSDGVLVCAVYDSRAGNDCRSDDHADDNDVEVEFTVRVPAGVTFRPATVEGDIEAIGLDGPVEARSVSGDVAVATRSTAEGHSVSGNVSLRDVSGVANAKSVSGDVQVAGTSFEKVSLETVSGSVSFDGDLPSGASLQARSVSGDVELRVPAGLSADIEVSTRGGFESELELTTRGEARESGRRRGRQQAEHFTAGGGGAAVSITTMSGGIHLRKQ